MPCPLHLIAFWTWLAFKQVFCGKQAKKYQHVAGVSAKAVLFILVGIVAGRKKTQKPVFRHRKLIGEAIRLRRVSAGLTQEALGERAELNPKYIGEVERGEKIISIEALLRIAKAVRTPIREFFWNV